MQHRRQHEHEADAIERSRVAVLRLDEIHHGVRQRTIVAHAAREHVVHAVHDAVVHHAGGEHARLDRAAQAAGAADRVDRAHVMAMAAFDRAAGLEVDAERRAVQRLLGIVDRERVAGQQHVDEAAADQLAEVHTAAGVHHHRTGDDGDAIAGALHFFHHRRDPHHADLDPPLGGDLVGHEREAEPIALAELGDDLDAAHADDDEVALPDVAQFSADRAGGPRAERGRGPGRDDDGCVHALAFDGEPLAVAPDERPMIRRRVEILGRARVAIGGDETRVLGPRQAAAERDELLEHLLQRRLGLRRNPHRDERRLFVRSSDPELQHLERRVVADDGVEHQVEEL